jgi:hypothetical protein
MPVIPEQKRLRQEDWEFKANLEYMGRPCLKNKKQQTTTYTHIHPKLAESFLVCMESDWESK